MRRRVLGLAEEWDRILGRSTAMGARALAPRVTLGGRMLQHDYLLEMISQFVEAITRSLRTALLRGDRQAARQVEDAVSGLLDLDPQLAMQLSPDSLVTMMILSGVGDSVAGYVAYSLRGLSDAYAAMGEGALSDLRLKQAQAMEQSFGAEPGSVPPEFRALEDELRQEGVRG